METVWLAQQNNIDSMLRKSLERSAQYYQYQYRRQYGCGYGNRVLRVSDIDHDELKTIMVSDVSVCHVPFGHLINQGHATETRAPEMQWRQRGERNFLCVDGLALRGRPTSSVAPKVFFGSIIAEVSGYWASHLFLDMTFSLKVGYLTQAVRVS